MLEPIMLFAKPLLPCDLAHTHYDMRRGIRAQVTRVVNYAHFALKTFGSLSITIWCHILPLITFNYAFCTSSTKHNPCTNFSRNHNVHSRLWHSLPKFLNTHCNDNVHHLEELTKLLLHTYIMYIASNTKPYWVSFEWANHTHLYILEPISLSIIHTIASLQLTSHSFLCEMEY